MSDEVPDLIEDEVDDDDARMDNNFYGEDDYVKNKRAQEKRIEELRPRAFDALMRRYAVKYDGIQCHSCGVAAPAYVRCNTAVCSLQHSRYVYNCITLREQVQRGLWCYVENAIVAFIALHTYITVRLHSMAFGSQFLLASV